jgi:septum formation protein
VIAGNMPLGLGSASPRRRELLENLGLRVQVYAPEVDEKIRQGESPDAYLERVVALKLDSVSREHVGAKVAGWIVADTVVLLEELILGKPKDVEDARRMLAALSGRSHEVRTRFAIGAAGQTNATPLHAETVRSEVWFRRLSPDEIASYAASGEGFDKAGAYAIQGLGSFAVARIDGSYSNIVGLPVCEVVLALKRLHVLERFPAF